MSMGQACLKYSNYKMQCFCNISRKNCYEVDVLHAYKHESFLQVDSIIFDGAGQACSKDLGKRAMSLWHLKKEVRNEVRYLTALVGSITALTIYYTSNVLPPLNLFLSQYGIHTKPFFHLINCLCNISLLLLFQVTVDACNLACFSKFLQRTNDLQTFSMPGKNLVLVLWPQNALLNLKSYHSKA